MLINIININYIINILITNLIQVLFFYILMIFYLNQLFFLIMDVPIYPMIHNNLYLFILIH